LEGCFLLSEFKEDEDLGRRNIDTILRIDI
jgi:hypothetical protein